jgi:hypothetical protein
MLYCGLVQHKQRLIPHCLPVISQAQNSSAVGGLAALHPRELHYVAARSTATSMSDKDKHLCSCSCSMYSLLLYLGSRAFTHSFNKPVSPTCMGLAMTRFSFFSYIFPRPSLTDYTDSPLTRQPSRFEGLSRTVRDYVPTSISIAIPSASPSPPRVSLPISFGRFMSPAHPSAPLDGTAGTDRRRSWGAEASAKTLDEVLTLDQHLSGQGGTQRSELPRYPRSNVSEHISWARWDTLPIAAGPAM